MKLGDLGEFGFIRRVAPGCIVAKERVVHGIGDDCSVTAGDGDSLHLVTTDLLVERVHFLIDSITAFQLGQKALAVNLSDIAAMGGTPLDAYVSIAIPDALSVAFLDDLYEGLKSMASRFNVNLLGGDTTGSRQDLIVNIAVTGSASKEHILYRHGAQEDDAIFLTGVVGDSGAGLHAILKGHTKTDENAAILARRHNEPTPHIEAGQLIAATGAGHAMIDVSDGVDADLGHVCDESGVGCIIETNRLPLSPPLTDYCRRFELDPVSFALAGGEDYVLLCTGEDTLIDMLSRHNVRLFKIGQITEDRRRIIQHPDGTQTSLRTEGWDHFRRKE